MSEPIRSFQQIRSKETAMKPVKFSRSLSDEYGRLLEKRLTFYMELEYINKREIDDCFDKYRTDYRFRYVNRSLCPVRK